MSFAINTNIASLQAQEYLRVNSDFQAKTINRVTSGLRIISSGDDAAGLAIANTFRSDQSVLAQGVRNANDGLSQLQIADGGISNISKLLDRARTLATQSASGAFTGDRSVLSGEFSTVLGEIDRQAQAIGLNQGGTFARSLSVFIGGGKTSGSTTAISNGSVTVDLSHSTVDSQSLGLKGVQATGVISSGTDIGTGSASTSVQAIVNLAANQASQLASGYTDFYFRGSGFSDANRAKVSVNLSGVTDTATLVAAIKTGIENTGNGTTQAATAFKNAGVTASIVTDANGSHLAFSSSNAAFQVSAGDKTSNALLGNVTSSSNPLGKALLNTVTGGATAAVTTTAFGASGAGTVIFRVQGSGLSSPVDLSIAVTAGETIDTALLALQTAVSTNASLQAAGITLTTATAGSALVLSNARGEAVDVATSGDLNNLFGLGSFQSSTGASGTFDYQTVTGAGGTFLAAAATLEISEGGGAKQVLTFTAAAATIASTLLALNNAFAGNATLSAAGFTASNSGGQILITNNTTSNFRINSIGAANVLGFNNAVATGVAYTANTQSTATTVATFDTGGAYQTAVLTDSVQRLGTDNQTITLSAVSAAGAQQSLAVSLHNNATPNARSLDETIATINTAILQSNNATLQKVVAVKEQAAGGGAEGIKFISTSAFEVSVGATADAAGIGSQGTLVTAAVVGTGATSNINTQDAAQNAVTALATAVSSLGSAQAVVGRGQNQFGYAINLASSQLTNLASAESRIRDADLASEAANLTKAQTLLQAGIAALAQANSAPQAVLALLRG
jgi:flagellin